MIDVALLAGVSNSEVDRCMQGVLERELGHLGGRRAVGLRELLRAPEEEQARLRRASTPKAWSEEQQQAGGDEQGGSDEKTAHEWGHGWRRRARGTQAEQRGLDRDQHGGSLSEPSRVLDFGVPSVTRMREGFDLTAHVLRIRSPSIRHPRHDVAARSRAPGILEVLATPFREPGSPSSASAARQLVGARQRAASTIAHT